MSWTKEERYRSINDATEKELLLLEENVSKSNWRQTYHIQPKYGLLNDPNGFCFYNNQYHLFYQWFPFGAVHGLKHWYHLTSPNLIDWNDEGVGLLPTLEHESHGIFSGTGIVKEEDLYLFYTGNHRDENWDRHSSQCLAILSKEGRIEKVAEPIISGPPDNYTHEFRDPKVVKKNDKYYLLVGAQKKESFTGCLLLYTSTNLVEWEFKQEVKTNHESFGFMWECPDIFELEGKDILLLSPQGIPRQESSFQNIYHSGVFVGKFNEQEAFFDTQEFQELDKGFDFYAPQTTMTPDGRQVLIGWMGLPDTVYPSDKESWANCLTIPRELSLVAGKVRQMPIRELQEKRHAKQQISLEVSNDRLRIPAMFSDPGEYLVTIELIEAKRAGIAFRVGDEEETICFIDQQENYFCLDRTKAGEEVAIDYGTTRKIKYTQTAIEFTVFLDHSSIELFINKGETTMTSRIFPKKESCFIDLFAEKGSASIAVTQWIYQ